MKTYLNVVTVLMLCAVFCSAGVMAQENHPHPPRIAIAGIGLEASIFSPIKTDRADFHPRYSQEIMNYYPFFDSDSSLIDEAVWIPTVTGHAMPGGIATREAYESFVSETISMLKDNLPLDGIFYDIHGAMSVEGMDDPEGDFIARIREAIGTDVLISTSMDLHGSVTPRLAQNTDLISAYRMAPHEDAMETKKRAVVNLLDRIKNDKGKPKYKAWVPVPILLPGEQTSTRVEPGKSLYAQIPDYIDEDKVQDVSIWMSYPWADQPRNHGVIMAYGDDKKEVKKAVKEIAEYYWSVRDEFDFVAPTYDFDKAIDLALDSDKQPFIISDTGDNPTGGGTGYVTWTLNKLLDMPEFTSDDGKSWIYGSVPDKDFVEKAEDIGVGDTINDTIGGEAGDSIQGPVHIKGKIYSIHKGHPSAKTEVVVQIGNSYVIITEDRMVYHHQKELTDLDLHPKDIDILVLKQGYLEPGIYDLKGDWVMALTPGGVDQDLFRLDYQRIHRPMYPLDKDMDPDLDARMIPLSDEIQWNIRPYDPWDAANYQ